MARAIDGDELLGIERLLDIDVIRKSKTASWLLDKVLHDIQGLLLSQPICNGSICARTIEIRMRKKQRAVPQYGRDFQR